METEQEKDHFELSIKNHHFRFNSAHFLTNPAEALHGHNYRVKIKLKGSKTLLNGMLMDFTYITPIVKDICGFLHQKTLLPRFSKEINICVKEKEAIEIFEKNQENKFLYRFPIEDCEILDIENVSAEELARYIQVKTEEKITKENLQKHKIKKMKISVFETQGSLATYVKKYQ